jgi:hypothetical protein
MTEMSADKAANNEPKKSRFTRKQFITVIAFGGLLLALWALAVGVKP